VRFVACGINLELLKRKERKIIVSVAEYLFYVIEFSVGFINQWTVSQDKLYLGFLLL